MNLIEREMFQIDLKQDEDTGRLGDLRLWYFDRTGFSIGSAMIFRIDESDGDGSCFSCYLHWQYRKH